MAAGSVRSLSGNEPLVGIVTPLATVVSGPPALMAGLPESKGIVGVGPPKGKALPITRMVEKPPRGTAPSNLIITGRYILQPEIFSILGKQELGSGGEIQLTDAMIGLARTSPFYGVKFEGRTFDCGSKVGFLAANVAYALARDDIAPEFRAEVEGLMKGPSA